MKDNFEKFIHENRREFDVYEPRESLWNTISEKITQKKPAQALAYCSRGRFCNAGGRICLLVEQE